MKNLILICAVLVCGCSAEKRFNDFAIKNPDKLKSLAAVLAPCVDVNPKSDTIYRSKTDTLITPGNTVIERRNDTVFVTKQLPGRIITKTDVQTVTKTVADSRALAACAIKTRTAEDMLLKAQTELAAAKKTLNTWGWIAIGCMAVIVIFVVIKTYTFISGGALKGLIK